MQDLGVFGSKSNCFFWHFAESIEKEHLQLHWSCSVDNQCKKDSKRAFGPNGLALSLGFLYP